MHSLNRKRKDALRLMDARIDVVSRVLAEMPQLTVGSIVMLVTALTCLIANLMLCVEFDPKVSRQEAFVLVTKVHNLQGRIGIGRDQRVSVGDRQTVSSHINVMKKRLNLAAIMLVADELRLVVAVLTTSRSLNELAAK